jgi:D-psicose/D-tagatose/L-ribulose 3-epimerase
MYNKDMNLAVSSIGWTNEEEADIAALLQLLGVKHVELAPTKLWDDPTNVSLDEAQKVVDWWAGYGITVSAFQSMLFARPDLKIFESDQNRQECLAYMEKFIELAGGMGARKMVFGSPKNRQRGTMPIDKAQAIAQEFFSKLGDVAQKNGVVLCLEPNAPQYNCDFITTTKEGDEFVRKVSNPGFGLHLDTACMALAGDAIGTSITNSKNILEHFHISSPMLEQVEARDDVDHRAAAQALREIGYDKLVSIEMRPGESGTNVSRVKAAVTFAQEVYFNA